MKSITIIGPGAIGGLVAAWLCQDPSNQVSIAARTPFNELALETDGETLRVEPLVQTDPSAATAADWALVSTKAYDSSAAADWFPAVVKKHTCVAVLQNGVDHVDRFSAWLPRDSFLPVVVDCPAERLGPGEIRQRGPASLTVPAGPLGTSFAELFTQTGIECRVVEDFLTIAWWKLCVNAAGVVNALVLQPARIAHHETAARLMRDIIEEAAAVGRAEGARLAYDIADEVIAIYRGHPPDSVNSLHADRAAGRPMELDLRNGVIVKRGKRHGIPTPCNEMAVALLKIV